MQATEVQILAEERIKNRRVLATQLLERKKNVSIRDIGRCTKPTTSRNCFVAKSENKATQISTHGSL